MILIAGNATCSSRLSTRASRAYPEILRLLANSCRRLEDGFHAGMPDGFIRREVYILLRAAARALVLRRIVRKEKSG